MLRNALFVLIIAAVGIVAYSNSLDVPFTIDDSIFIEKNPLLKDSSYFLNPEDAKLQPLPGPVRLHYKTRYLGFFTLFLNNKFHGLNLFWLHATNLAMHLINALLVYLFVKLIFRTPEISRSQKKEHAHWIALAAALLFVSHPLQTQAVTYLSSRFTLLVAMFYLLATILYAYSRISGKRSYYILALAATVIAMYSKENAFTLPVALLLYEFMFFRDSLKKTFIRLAPFFATMVIVPLGHINIEQPVSEMFDSAMSLSSQITRSQYLFTQFKVIIKYIGLIFVPMNQNFFHYQPIYDSFFDIPVLMSFMGIVCILAVLGLLYRRSTGGEPASRLLVFGWLWFFLALAVESSVIVLNIIVSEHRIYLPSAGLFVGLSTGLFILTDRFAAKGGLAVAIGLVFVLTVILSTVTVSRNELWRDKIVFFEHEVKISPESHMAQRRLADVYAEADMIEKAEKHYIISRDLNPGYKVTSRSLGLLYLNIKRYEEAIEIFENLIENQRFDPSVITYAGRAYEGLGKYERAIELYSLTVEMSNGHFLAHNNLGMAYYRSGDSTKAIEHLNNSITNNPDYSDSYYSLGNIYASRRELSNAVKNYEKAISLSPKAVHYYVNLGNSYAMTGNVNKAIEAFKGAISVNDGYADAHYNLGNAYMEKGSAEQAIEHYGKVKELEPEFPDINYNLGNAYLAKGSLDAAIEQYEMAIDINPKDPRAHNNLGVAYYKKGMSDKAREHFNKADSLMKR